MVDDVRYRSNKVGHLPVRRALNRLKALVAHRPAADRVERDRRVRLRDRVDEAVTEIAVDAVEHMDGANATQQIHLLLGTHDIDQRDAVGRADLLHHLPRSDEHTSELQSLMRISYDVF